MVLRDDPKTKNETVSCLVVLQSQSKVGPDRPIDSSRSNANVRRSSNDNGRHRLPPLVVIAPPGPVQSSPVLALATFAGRHNSNTARRRTESRLRSRSNRTRQNGENADKDGAGAYLWRGESCWVVGRLNADAIG